MNSVPLPLAEVRPIRLLLDGLEQELFKRTDQPAIPLKTLPDLSKKLWGLQKGLTVVGARTSNGKSAFALQVAYDMAIQNIPTVFLSLEMSRETLIERLFCTAMRVDNFQVLTGQLRKQVEMQAKWLSFKKNIVDKPLLITDGIGKTYDELIALIEHLDPKPKVIILDYAQMVANADEREHLGEFIRKYRKYAVKNGIVGIMCSQINRAGGVDGQEPTMDYLKGSGVLEEAADVCLLLHWPYLYKHTPETFNQYKIMVAKNRNGRTGYHDLQYQPQFYRFNDISDIEKEPEVQAAKEQFNGQVVP